MKLKRFRDWSVKARANCGVALAGGGALTGLSIGIVYSEPITNFFVDCCGGDTTMTIAFWAVIAVLVLMWIPIGIIVHFYKKGKRKKKLDTQQTRVAELEEEYYLQQIRAFDNAKQKIKDEKEIQNVKSEGKH